MDYSRLVFEAAGAEHTSSSPNYAFVGIHAKDGKLIFRLPIGYPVPQGQQPYEVGRNLHILFFKLFNSFRSVAKRNHDRQKKNAPPNEDAGASLQGGREWITHHEEGDVYYYRHFDAFDSLLEVFDELAILSLERRLRLTESHAANLGHFERTADGRIYHDDDTFFDDKTVAAVPTLTVQPTDMVGLYCFLLRDLRDHVWGDHDHHTLGEEIRVLAERFEAEHLWPTASCWEAEEWENCRHICRDKLELIDRMTALKDGDYHRLYDAVMRFLYPPTDDTNGSGILWGLDGFWPVWEWAVLTRLATAEPFKQRLCWVENGNLAPDTIDTLLQAGFRHPLGDKEVLCNGSGDWDTFLLNGQKLGHPYPDAVLSQADFSTTVISEEECKRVEQLCLSEGRATMTLSGTQDWLVVTEAESARVSIGEETASQVVAADEKQLPVPTLQVMSSTTMDLDRPETFAMLRSLGEWDGDGGAFWHYAPFKNCLNAKRKNLSGVLLIDAKYKVAEDSGPLWAVDHRKQAAYEDALTISCSALPAAYSIYICPGQSVSQQLFAELVAQELALRAQFEIEFQQAWAAVPEVDLYNRRFKRLPAGVTVMGVTVGIVGSKSQEEIAKGKLERQIFSHETSLMADLENNWLAASLLGVKRFPGNDLFFLKEWPIRDLFDEILDAD